MDESEAWQLANELLSQTNIIFEYLDDQELVSDLRKVKDKAIIKQLKSENSEVVEHNLIGV